MQKDNIIIQFLNQAIIIKTKVLLLQTQMTLVLLPQTQMTLVLLLQT